MPMQQRFAIDSLEPRLLLSRATGCDISQYQGTMNWTTYKNAGTSFAFIRASASDGSTTGGASGEHDFADAVRTAVINKRAGGMGLISGRKAFQRPMEEGVKLLNLIQDVYLDKEITIA